MLNLDDYKSEILFLLIGNNPLPNYVAARLLSKPFVENKTVICLIYSPKTKDSEGTAQYAKNLIDVLGNDNFIFYDVKVNPWDYSSIQKGVESRISEIKKLAQGNMNFSVGLNYTGGTKAMAVHTYRAIMELEKSGIITHFSYLDSDQKKMRIDVKNSNKEIAFDLSDEKLKYFEQTKISLDNLLKLHGFETKGVLNKSITTNFDPNNLPNFKSKELESYILQTVISLKDECNLDSICSNLEIINPKVSKTENYCEIDVVAIRGYQLFAISCTTAKIDEQIIKSRKCPSCQNELKAELLKECKDDVKHILTHKIFQVSIRAKELGGAEAKNSLVSKSDSDRTKNLRTILKNDNIEVFGKDDLKDLPTKLKVWFNKK